MTDTSEHTASLRVLHLEDDPVDAELIQRKLEDHNIRCLFTRVCTEKDFETAIQKGDVDCILSDSHLPGFDTLSALVLTRETRPAVPFIFVSGNDSPQIKADAMLLGASDFISKNELPKLAKVLHQLFFSGKTKSKFSRLPETRKPVIVQCKGFRCLGYLDRDGKWRDFEKSSELPEVIDWYEL